MWYLRGLKDKDERLGNDIVDFVLSRLYMQADEGRQREVHILSSWVTKAIWNSKSVEGIGWQWLRPPSRVEIEQVKELIVPWVSEDHWSVLIFQSHRVLHMDSYNGTFHHLRGQHS